MELWDFLFLKTLFLFRCTNSNLGSFIIKIHSTLLFFLIVQLHSSGITKTKMFALCFRTGGGVVTLGGVDTSLHVGTPDPTAALTKDEAKILSNRTSDGGIHWVAMLKPKVRRN